MIGSNTVRLQQATDEALLSMTEAVKFELRAELHNFELFTKQY
jgi:hypothetical protein